MALHTYFQVEPGFYRRRDGVSLQSYVLGWRVYDSNNTERGTAATLNAARELADALPWSD